MVSWHNWANQDNINMINDGSISTENNKTIKEQKTSLVNDNKELKKKCEQLESELEFYKSIFKTHINSCVFQLHIKTINGEKVWVDPIRCDRSFLLTLDKDEEVDEWLRPVKCER